MDQKAVSRAEFIKNYDRLRLPEKLTPEFAVIALGKNEREAVSLAIERAMEDGFFVSLFTALQEEAVAEFPDDARLKAIPAVRIANGCGRVEGGCADIAKGAA